MLKGSNPQPCHVPPATQGAQMDALLSHGDFVILTTYFKVKLNKCEFLSLDV
jgi:hypothetical protein